MFAVKLTAPDVVAEIGMGPANNLKVMCTAEKAWGWTYMAISRYEGDSQYSLEFLGKLSPPRLLLQCLMCRDFLLFTIVAASIADFQLF